jgi:intracellular septation protein
MTTDTDSEKAPGKSAKRLSGRAKFLVDFGPLLVFFVAYFLGRRLAAAVGAPVVEGEELFLAMTAFLPAFAVAFVYSVVQERRIAPMLLVSGVVVGVLGGLALFFHDKTFIFIKPTIVYLMFAVALAGGLATGRNFLKALFDGALHLEDGAWRKLTRRYVVFFALLAVANEIAWRWLTRDCDLAAAARCAGEANWVNLKIWGFTFANIAFAAAQAPFLIKHGRPEAAPSSVRQSPSDEKTPPAENP